MRRVAWPASLVLGLVLMLGFEHALTRVLGLLCLAAFVVIGVSVIARPEFLEGPPPQEPAPDPDRPPASAARDGRRGGAA